MLLLDLGNTRFKWDTLDGTRLSGAAHALAWHEDMAGVLHDAWQGLSRPTCVWAASVAGADRERRVEEAVAVCFDLSVTWVHTPREACDVRTAYDQPRDLGVDRFLSMVAAHADGLGSCVLASCGTALTLDALHADGRHAGGLIAPGPTLMQRSVRGATAQVHPSSPGRLMDAADSTADALVSGCWQACAALIERFFRHMSDQWDTTPRLLLAGGDGEALLPLLDYPGTLYPDAVLRGLAVWVHAGESQ